MMTTGGAGALPMGASGFCCPGASSEARAKRAPQISASRMATRSHGFDFDAPRSGLDGFVFVTPPHSQGFPALITDRPEPRTGGFPACPGRPGTRNTPQANGLTLPARLPQTPLLHPKTEADAIRQLADPLVPVGAGQIPILGKERLQG